MPWELTSSGLTRVGTEVAYGDQPLLRLVKISPENVKRHRQRHNAAVPAAGNRLDGVVGLTRHARNETNRATSLNEWIYRFGFPTPAPRHPF